MQLDASTMSCIATLREKGLKLTPQRRLILAIIHESGAHLTGEDIISAVQARMPEVNKSTVYRTLDLLHELGCVFKSEADGRFIYHHAEEGHHHHIECHICGKTVDCDEDLFHPIERALDEKYGFRVSFKHTVIRGVCRDCRIRP